MDDYQKRAEGFNNELKPFLEYLSSKYGLTITPQIGLTDIAIKANEATKTEEVKQEKPNTNPTKGSKGGSGKSTK